MAEKPLKNCRNIVPSKKMEGFFLEDLDFWGDFGHFRCSLLVLG